MNTIELSEFLCSTCKECHWLLFLGRDENDKIYLIPMCKNCQTLDQEGEQPTTWGEFEITDQLPEEVKEQILSSNDREFSN